MNNVIEQIIDKKFRLNIVYVIVLNNKIFLNYIKKYANLNVKKLVLNVRINNRVKKYQQYKKQQTIVFFFVFFYCFSFFSTINKQIIDVNNTKNEIAKKQYERKFNY